VFALPSGVEGSLLPLANFHYRLPLIFSNATP
jgi:hypothetical protein